MTGGSADVCELQSGDEIITLNGTDVSSHYLESVQKVIVQAVASGQLELRVRRLAKPGQYSYYLISKSRHIVIILRTVFALHPVRQMSVTRNGERCVCRGISENVSSEVSAVRIDVGSASQMVGTLTVRWSRSISELSSHYVELCQ